MKVLVVDDEDAVRALAARILLGAGFEVDRAANGEDALRRLSPEIDIVLTDLAMPGSVDGNELTRRARAAGSADVLIFTGNPQLDTAVQALRDGAYDYLFKPFSPDSLLHAVRRCADKRRLSQELAREKALRAELDAACAELKRAARVREVFGQFATPEVAAHVLADGGDAWRRGERRVLTVLFADVRRFTPFAGLVPPERAVEALNRVFEPVVEAVRRNGGIVNKFLGDGLLAFFGAPLPLDGHAGAAARAALEAVAAVEALAREEERVGGLGLRIGVGINTGEVVAGLIGTRARGEYGVIGHAVNLASRLEEAAAPGEILLGPETVRGLDGGLRCRRRGILNLAGIREPIEKVTLAPEPQPAPAR